MPMGIYERKKIPWNKKIISRDILENLYSKRKLSSVQCGKLLNCSNNTILARLKEYSFHIRNISESLKGISCPSRQIQIDEERLKELYVDKKLNMVKCGEILGCSYNIIRRRLANLNIPIRKSETEFKKGEYTGYGQKTRFKNGENHPFWKGGISSLYDKIKQTLRYKSWRDLIYARDHWCCQLCGKHCERGDIVAHHLKSFADYPELRFDVDNGITLCRSCHLNIHLHSLESKFMGEVSYVRT